MSPLLSIPRTACASVRQNGDRVLLTIDGRTLDLPWDAADALAKALTIKAREAEEIAKAANIIEDSAILLRAGVPIGLSSNPQIQAEAAKEAAWNTRLRKYMPGGVRSREAFGRPTITKGG